MTESGRFGRIRRPSTLVGFLWSTRLPSFVRTGHTLGRPSKHACLWTAISLFVCGVVACNPVDRLPPPRCRSAVHCLPGVACEGGECRASGRLELSVTTQDVAQLELRAAGLLENARSSRARRVYRGAAKSHGGVARFRIGGLPSLPTWIVAWAGYRDSLCAGTACSVVRLTRKRTRSRGRRRRALHRKLAHTSVRARRWSRLPRLTTGGLASRGRWRRTSNTHRPSTLLIRIN